MTIFGATFVTGGSGVVGKPLVRRLVAEGREVRALARSQAAAEELTKLGARPVMGDLGSTESLAEGMNGCGSVFHVGGVNAFCLVDPSPMFSINVLGSLNVIKSAAQAGVERVVYTSSASTVGEEHGTVGTEVSAHRGYFLSEYERSKYEAEKVVLSRAGELGIDVVSVNPSSVQGPGRSGGTGRFLVMYLRGKLKVFVPTNISIVDIDDCAQGHLLAETKGEPGERYLLNSGWMPIEKALGIVRRLAGYGTTPRPLPGPLAYAAGTAVGAVFRIAGKHPPICREMIRTLLHGHTYDGSKAARELGLQYTPLDVTFEKTIRWLRDQGLVP